MVSETGYKEPEQHRAVGWFAVPAQSSGVGVGLCVILNVSGYVSRADQRVSAMLRARLLPAASLSSSPLLSLGKQIEHKSLAVSWGGPFMPRDGQGQLL